MLRNGRGLKFPNCGDILIVKTTLYDTQACTDLVERFFSFQGANQVALEMSNNCSPASRKQQQISITMKNHSMQKLSFSVWKKTRTLCTLSCGILAVRPHFVIENQTLSKDVWCSVHSVRWTQVHNQTYNFAITVIENNTQAL